MSTQIYRWMRSIVTGVSIALTVMLLTATEGRAVEEEWALEWTRDLRYLAIEVVRQHPNPFHEIDRASFEDELYRLERRLSELEHHEITVELGRIMASVGDGHTRLTLPLAAGIDFFQGHSTTPPPRIAGLLLRQLPVRFGLFAEGLFIERIDATRPDASTLLGARVVGLGQHTADEAMALVEPTIERDNAMQIRHHLPQRLALAEVLHARGVTTEVDRVPMRLELADGEVVEVVLEPVEPDNAPQWLSLGDGSEALRDHRPEAYHWLEPLPEAGVLYVQLNQIGHTPERSMVDLAREISEGLLAPDIDRLVLDLRLNRGGDNSLNMPLLHALIRSVELEQPASFFVLIGRTTFSAAMMLSVDLERHLQVVFVGEPTGSSPNHYGDSRKVRLPGSGLTVRISTREWQYSHPLEDRPYIEPLIHAPQAATDRAAGRDPALEAVFDFTRMAPGEPAGRWQGQLSYSRRLTPLVLELGGGTKNHPLTARVGLPELGLAGLEATEVRRDGARISLRLDLEGELLRFAGEIRGGTLIGRLDDRRRGGAFVLERQASRPHAP